MLLMIPDAISRKYNGMLSRSFRDDNILLFVNSPSSVSFVSKKCEMRIVHSI